MALGKIEPFREWLRRARVHPAVRRVVRDWIEEAADDLIWVGELPT